MSCGKQDQFHREEEEIARGARVMENPQSCSLFIGEMGDIPTGFAFIVVEGQGDKEFECPICLCLIKGATELPCEHLMCGDCLLHYEKGQTEKAEK